VNAQTPTGAFLAPPRLFRPPLGARPKNDDLILHG
jgi:hypothetical protein